MKRITEASPLTDLPELEQLAARFVLDASPLRGGGYRRALLGRSEPAAA